MAVGINLQGEILSLSGEVERLMAANGLNLATAATLLDKLRSCQDRALHAGLDSSARQLRAAANQLAMRINSESKT